MSSGGLAPARLARMREIIAGHVERGDVHVDVAGQKAFGAASSGNGPMQRDTIFRIASMTKPVTAAATMILVEDCRLRLDEPVDPWLPELANRKVLKRVDGPLDDTVPAS